MRILIAGCGYVGARLAQRLSDEGHEVFCIRRSAGTGRENWFTLPMDLCEPLDVERLPCELDAVVYLPAAQQRDQETFERLYTLGPNQLYQAVLMNSSGFRFMLVSTTGVYAQQDGCEVDEASEAAGSTASSKALLQGEQLLEQFPHRCIVRFSGIYGPERHRLVRQVREGTPVPEALLERYLNQIHVDDCVGVLDFLLKHPSPPERLVASDTRPTRRIEVLRWLAREMDCALPEPAAAAPPHNSRGQTNKQCCSKKIRDLGYEFIYPTYREGYTEILKDEASTWGL